MNKEITKIKLDDLWLKATVLGSLWASFEIIVGSLLHNLRLPFAGTILTAFAVVFIISFYQLWPEKGIIWRAGLICALMKSISPSAVILGPMIGILTEALIIEFIIRITGKNLFSYILGGALAVFSALLHKVINLIILYGFDLIEIYMNMFNYASEKLNIPESVPVNVLYLFSLIYVLAGIVAAIAGYILGKRAVLKTKYPEKYILSENLHKQEPNQKSYSIPLLLLHFLFILSVLYLFSVSDNYLIILIITTSYITFTLFYYKKIARRLLKPLFWIQLALIMLLAAVFLEYSSKDGFSFYNGFISGLRMLMRAIIIISGFSAISYELANPKIRDFLIQRGFIKVYLSLQLAFSALPVMIERNSEIKKFIKRPFHTFSAMIADAENWLETFKSKNI